MMEKTYTPLVMPLWSNSPTANEGHIDDVLPDHYSNWEEAIANNDFISYYTVLDEKGERYYKIVYTKEPDSPVYVLWTNQDPRFGPDIADLSAAMLEIKKIKDRIGGKLN